MKRRASVIINTLDRADSLDLLLGGLRLQWFDGDFEVVVVTGPCKDHTLEVVERWKPAIKHRVCERANLSMSRNIGIAAAAGEVVVFIDDDAVPEPRWLTELLAPFEEDPEIGATGGYVWDHTGFELQCRFNRCDRLGGASYHAEEPLDELCFPGTAEFPYLPGGNSAWDRGRLVANGGFDENFEYYLDEVDVAVRMIDAGWVLHQVAGAAIHHKFLPSSVRSSNKVLAHRYAVLKNKLLFGLLNGRSHHTLEEVLGEAAGFTAMHRRDLLFHIERGALDAAALKKFDDDAERALADGMEIGLAEDRCLRGEWLEGRDPGDFVKFPALRPDGGHRRYVFLTQTLPPDPVGGIGRFMLDVARGMAAKGHEIRIITDGVDHDTIDLEQGVWVHRLVKPELVEDPVPAGLVAPERIWANAVRVDRELQRLCADHWVDAVYTTLWDAEAAAIARRSTTPVVLTLVTSLALALESNPTWASAPGFMEEFGSDMVELERRHLLDADLIHSISNTVAREVQRSSAVELDSARVRVAGLGTPDPNPSIRRPGSAQSVNLLFVGRFEKRKGVDLLLEALARLLPELPQLTATLIGKDDLPGPGGDTWLGWLSGIHEPGPWMERLRVLGEVTDERLHDEYERADLFVAPSRFESFGLVYVEAMARALPVIALDLGSAPEVLAQGTAGVLVGADASALAAAITDLVLDPEKAKLIGAAGRKRYEQEFTLAKMVRRVEDILGSVSSVRVDDMSWSGGTILRSAFAGGVMGRGVDSDVEFVLPGRAEVVLTCRSDAGSTVARISVAGEDVRVDLPVGGSVHRVPVGSVEKGELIRFRSVGPGEAPYVVGPVILLSQPLDRR